MALIERLHRGIDRLAGWPGVRRHELDSARRRFVANRSDNLFFGVHETWDEAQAAAQAFGRVGYDNAEVVDLYVQRTRKDPHDYPSLYWLLRSLHEGSHSVFDVGGNIGIKYLAFKEALVGFQDLLWCVQDVPAVVRRGRELADQRGEGSRLRFTDQLEDGDGIDVLFASGVLQYLPNTLAEILSGYRALPRRIVINTAAVHPEHAFYTVNSITTAFCPYRVQTQAGLIGGLTSLGYRLRETWINPDKPLVIPLRPDRSLKHYSGFCLELPPA